MEKENGKQELLFCVDDLVEEILFRLHVKTLMRFKCVSKRWLNLISDKSFITRFIQRSSSRPPIISGVFYLNKVDERVNFSSFGNETEDADSVDTSLSFLQDDDVVVLASHSGVLLCGKKPERMMNACHLADYILCNPLTKKWMFLPEPLVELELRSKTLLYCYDSGGSRRIEFMVVYFSKLEMQIYSSETRTWKNSKFSRGWDFNLQKATLFSECVYVMDLACQNLWVYDLKKESIRYSKLPTVKHADAEHGLLGGLGLLGVSSGSLYYAQSDLECFYVWVLVDEDQLQWCLVQSIKKRLFPRFCPLAIHPTHNHLVLVQLLDIGETKVALYDTNKKSIEVFSDIHQHDLFPIVSYSVPACPPCMIDGLL